MGSILPTIDERSFLERLKEMDRCLAEIHASEPSLKGQPRIGVSDPGFVFLREHFQEMKKWNPRVSLVGPGTANEILDRHYGESLAGISFLRPSDRNLVDVGSGGGFPGFVLAATVPHLSTFLIEPREKKRLFLRSAIRRCQRHSSQDHKLLCHVINGRVDASIPVGLPETIDVVTSRALAWTREMFGLFLELSPSVRFLIWSGEEDPDLPKDLSVGREFPLPGSERRRILEIRTSLSGSARR